MRKRYFALVIALATAAWAQTGTGNIQGTVKDASGAVVPGARVTVNQSQTSRQSSTTTSEIGYYLIPSVQIGQYTISVEAPGMETWKGEFTLRVGQTAVVDVNLKVGQTATEITVAGDVTELVTSTAPTLSTVVERGRIEQLPLNTRLIFNLIGATTPGLEIRDGNRGSMQTYGLRYATGYLQDGAVVENRDWGFVSLRPPGIDTVEEFRVETHNSSAKMNRPATVITTTRAGSNQVHGSLFETARNNGIGVARRRTDYYDKPPQLVRNEFGASLGGPVFLPKVYDGHNRTFFFFSWEALRLRSNSTRAVSVPTAAMREGDFSALVDGVGRAYTIYDPWSVDPKTYLKVPYPNNRLPLAKRSPLATYLYSVTPMPTLTGVNPLLASNWYGTGFSNQNSDTVTTRVDHRLRERDQLSFRFSYSPNHQETTNAQGNSPTTLDRKANGYVWNSFNTNGVATWTHTFSPTFFSETVAAVSADHWGQVPISGMVDIDKELGLPNPFGGNGFPKITNTGLTMDYYAGINYTLNYSKIFNFDQNFTKIYGRHTFQFGGRYRYEMLDTLPDATDIAGQADFGSAATAIYDTKTGAAWGVVPQSGHNTANMFLGIASLYQANFRRGWYHVRSKELAGYLQDDIKLNSRLTLNLGLRYEYASPIKEINNAFVGFDPKRHSVIVPNSVDELVKLGLALPSIVDTYRKLGVSFISQKEAGIPESFVHKNPWDFGPRAGFAWRTTGGSRPLVIRGGYAIFAYPEPLREWNTIMAGSLPGASLFSAGWNTAQQSPDGLANYYLRHAPAIIAGVNSSGVISLDKPQGITRGSAPVTYLDPNSPTARAHQWTLMFEREILQNTSVRFGYAGTHGARLIQLNYYNQAPAAYVWYASQRTPLPTGEYAGVATRPFDNSVYGTLGAFQKTGWSNDQAFQVEIERRFSKGYAFQAFYIMSNALRVAGDGWRDDILLNAKNYLPGAVPEDDAARNRFLFYKRDTVVPKHRLNYNWIADLPFGRGKRLGGNAGRVLDRVIGGWQIAGTGSITSNYFALPTNFYGINAPDIETYGKKYPVQDCRSGICYPGYLYYNGYIPANRINSYDTKTGKPNGVMGVPDSYKPAQQPFFPTPKDGGSAADPNFRYYETNTTWVQLDNGTLQQVAYNNNLHPWRNQYELGPMSFNLNASLFKTVRFTEKVSLRINADFFNVLNMAGTPQPGSDGIIQMRNSAYAPRQLQLTGRLTW